MYEERRWKMSPRHWIWDGPDSSGRKVYIASEKGAKMIRRAVLTYLLVFLYIFVAVVNLAAADGGRVALVIGNADYKGEPLSNPVNDAASIANTLKKLGFTVDMVTNASRRQMSEAINQFGNKLKRNEVGFFYFSGHGAQVNGENYLIPTDAQIENEREIKYATVHIGEVLDAMADAKNSVNIVIIDACRNNPFARSWRSSSRGLAPIHAAKGMIIAYSTAPGNLASDGPAGGNSPYMKHLMSQMLNPGLPVEQVFKKVRNDVQRETGGKQMPWESSSLIGDFSFNPSTKLATLTASIPSPGPSFSPSIPSPAPPSFVGSWHWYSDVPWEPTCDLTINADGTWKNNLGQVGTWNSPGGDKNHVVVVWSPWYLHDMILSANGLSMSGKNNFGVEITARKLSGP
jgi:hypothetical protein